MTQLSSGSIEVIMDGQKWDKPILQVLGFKKINNQTSTTDRYRLLISDGKIQHSCAMLATQLNSLVTSGRIDNYCVIQVDSYVCNMIAEDKKVLILLEVKILQPGSEVGVRLGNPVPSKSGTSGKSTVAKPSPTPPAAIPSLSSGLPLKPLNSNHVAPLGSLSKGSPSVEAPGRIHPIASLNPYQNRWTIRARVTQKPSIRHYSNSRGEGKLFSCNFLDESAEIRATAFNQEVDRFYDLLEVGKIYYVSRCSLKTANKQFSNVSNDYEMTFGRDSQVTLCDDSVELPQIELAVTKIAKLDTITPNAITDVMGVVISASEPTTIITRAQKELVKRDVQIVDESGSVIRCTLWGEDALKFDHSGNPVMAVKGVKVSEFGGRSLSLLSSSQLLMNPDFPAAHLLRGWYEREGRQMQFTEFAVGENAVRGSSLVYKTFASVKSEGLGHGEKPDYYHVSATIASLKKDNCMYQACPSGDCNKKVIDQGDNTYRCEKCDKSFPNFQWRLILQANLADHTDNLWVTCFQEVAECILGRSAEEIGTLKETNEQSFDDLFQDATFNLFNFRLRSKVETFNDETRLKTIVVSCSAIDYVEASQRLLAEIEVM